MKSKIHFISLSILCIFLFTLSLTSKTGGDIDKYVAQIEQKQPKFLFIGNSILRAGVDEEVFEKEIGASTLKHTLNGSASAWWHLYSKNVLSKVKNKPEYIFIFFRDQFLTEPQFRTSGTYSRPLRQISDNEEKRLDQLVFSNTNSSSKLWHYLPSEFHAAWDKRVLKVAADIFRVPKAQLREKLASTFDEVKMQADLLTALQVSSEDILEKRINFSDGFGNSFLPDIIDSAQKNDVIPVFVRVQRRRVSSGIEDSWELKEYLHQLETYIKKNDGIFLDLSAAQLIDEGKFAAGDHLNHEGKRIQTAVLCSEVKSLIINTM